MNLRTYGKHRVCKRKSCNCMGDVVGVRVIGVWGLGFTQEGQSSWGEKRFTAGTAGLRVGIK